MRKVLIGEANTIIMIAGLFFILMLVFAMPTKPRMWLYPLVRQAVQIKVNYETRNMATYETAHFRIKYAPVDADTVSMIGQAAEAAYDPVVETLQYAPAGKTLILIHSNKSQLRKAFGWSGNESAMGVYWGGTIQLLSPHVWLNDGESVEEFIHSGPMVHEYTHLVFDHITNGNYPRWFTEGLAQYVEYRANRYEWITADNVLDDKMYSMRELEDSFDELPNQSLAYRQSLAAVRYIAEVYGDDTLQEIVKSLKTGKSLEKAIGTNVGMDYATFENSWKQWAVVHMNTNIKK
ncbi:peptidase MA family metallohydrolase [Pelosinus propionicus]|uniref:Peptidase MA superfamily protein n=1 Tax=Pelosinus propionicus DSM 13327 TaxID=1123291 RepID=A0A1I4IZV9_9FIRM|nr:peptidase MA family metallohydrolase [Pelosinus propionicus]SFL59869.1 Peptidase MA superfamily protein [Pelosinus propionicus DSM 13327]